MYTSPAAGVHVLCPLEAWRAEQASPCKLLLCGKWKLSLYKDLMLQLLVTVGMCQAGTGCKGQGSSVASVACSGSGESQGA